MPRKSRETIGIALILGLSLLTAAWIQMGRSVRAGLSGLAAETTPAANAAPSEPDHQNRTASDVRLTGIISRDSL